MEPYRRELLLSTTSHGEITRSVARLDDPLHGFEVILDVRDARVSRATAATHRHPWATCPGALASVDRLTGVAVSELRASVFALPRTDVCIHVNDLVVAAGSLHRQRVYNAEVIRDRAVLTRDAAPCLDWTLHDYSIRNGGAFEGLSFRDPRWAGALDAVGADADLREAVWVLRHSITVSMGYYELDWETIEVGGDIGHDVMADSCHTFTTGRFETVACLVGPPMRRDRATDSRS